MSFLDNLFTSGVASALNTPTGSISVNTTTPIMDAVLKVISISPLRAGWVSGGSGAPVLTPVVVTGGTLNAAVDHAYLIVAPCVVTLPDATDPANVGHSIDLMFLTGPNTINNPTLESPNLMVDSGAAVQSMSISDAGVLITSVYDPAHYPSAGFWVAQRYYRKPTTAAPPVVTCQIHSVYPEAELPSPFDTTTVGGVTTISGNGSTVGSLQRDMAGTYSPGDLVLMMFLTTAPGLYRCVRDNGGTDWAFDFVEGPSSPADPNGNVTYVTLQGETWGRRRIVCRQTEDPFYVFDRQALDFYPNNGDILATGSNSGLVHSNTTQLLPGRVNMVATSSTYHDFTLAAPDANQERMFGERFGVKCAQFSAPQSFTIEASPATIEGPDGLVADSTTFTLQLCTYAEWELMIDSLSAPVWRLVSWVIGNAGA